MTVVDKVVNVSATRAQSVNGIPAGATCAVWETDAQGGISSNGVDNPISIDIEPMLGTDAEVQSATITNDFPLTGAETDTAGATSSSVGPSTFAEATPVEATTDANDVQALMVTATNTFDYGSLELNKLVDGPAASYVGDRKFTLDVSCVLPQAGTDTVILDAEPFTVTAGESVVIDELPVGAHCWAEESDRGGATEVAIDHSTPDTAAVVDEDEAVAISVTNSFAAAELVVGKTVVNGPAGPYGFTLTCSTDQGSVALAQADASFQLKHGETRTISVPEGPSVSWRRKP